MTLIENARQAWRFASVRLALGAGAVAQWAAMDPRGYAELMEALPLAVRLLAGVIVAGAAIGARVVKLGGKGNG
jgi:hypothetical protein